MRMTITNKLYVGIGILATVLAGLTIYSQTSLRETRAAIAEIDHYPRAAVHDRPRASSIT